MRRSRPPHSGGFVLVPVVLMLALVATIAFLVRFEGALDATATGRELEGRRAALVAEAGLNEARWRFTQNTSCTGYTNLATTAFGSGTYSATVTPTSGSPVSLSAVGSLRSGVQRTLQRTGVKALQAPTTKVLQLGAGAGEDTLIDSSNGTKNYGGSSTLRVSADPTARRRTLLRFDLRSLPVGASVVSARLELRMSSVVAPGPAAIHRVKRSWVEGTSDGSTTADGATWWTHNGLSFWTTSGGELYATEIAETEITSGATWVAWEIAPLVEGWLAGEPNYGLLINGKGALRTAEFASREENDSALRPKLTITYACECGVACTLPQGTGKVLMVVSNAGAPSAQESIKKAIFESWGYTVDTLDQNASAATYTTKVGANEVVFVPDSANDAMVGTKLSNVGIGVVNEEGLLNDELGVATSAGWSTGDTFSIADDTHYITEPFQVGPLRIYAAPMEGTAIAGAQAPELRSLGTWGATPGLATLEAGALTSGGGTAAGRRALLPLGRNLDWRYLNNNGRLIVQRAIEWGKGAGAGPVAHWKLDDGAGLTALDSEGGHHGTLTNGPIWEAGRLAGALAFDGVDDYVGLTSDPELDDVFSGGATLLAWIKPKTWGENNNGRVLDKDDNLTAPGSGWAVELDGVNRWLLLQQGFSSAGGEWAVPTDALTLNHWQHVAISYDSSAAANDPVIYLDGVVQPLTELRTPSGTARSDAALGLRLGNYSLATSRTFNGLIDDVRIYRGLLTAAEIADLAAESGAASGYYLDQFPDFTCDGADEYRGSSGTLDWSAQAWAEVGDDGRACGANFRVIDDPVVPDPTGNRLRLQNKTRAVHRVVDLSGIETAFLSFDYRRASMTGSAAFNVWVSNDGGSNWNSVATIAAGNDGGFQSASYDISSLIAPTITIAFSTNSSFAGEAYLDNVRLGPISGGGGGSVSPPKTGTFRDEFKTAGSYAGNDGTLGWSTAWLEVNESDGPASGDEVIEAAASGGYLARVRDNDGGGEGLEREADLSGSVTATLTFTYWRQALDDAGDYVAVLVSADGTIWHELAHLAGPATDAQSSPQSASFDISAYIGSKTRIRFLTSPNMGGSDAVLLDDIQIQLTD